MGQAPGNETPETAPKTQRLENQRCSSGRTSVQTKARNSLNSRTWLSSYVRRCNSGSRIASASVRSVWASQVQACQQLPNRLLRSRRRQCCVERHALGKKPVETQVSPSCVLEAPAASIPTCFARRPPRRSCGSGEPSCAVTCNRATFDCTARIDALARIMTRPLSCCTFKVESRERGEEFGQRRELFA